MQWTVEGECWENSALVMSQRNTSVSPFLMFWQFWHTKATQHAQVSWSYTSLFQTDASLQAKLHMTPGEHPYNLKTHNTFSQNSPAFGSES